MAEVENCDVHLDSAAEDDRGVSMETDNTEPGNIPVIKTSQHTSAKRKISKTPLKMLMLEKITQSSGANSEHKHSKTQRFSASNELISQKTLSLSTVNKLSDLY